MRGFLFQDPTLSKAQSFYRKEIHLPLMFSSCSRLVGRERGTRWAGRRSLVFGRGAASQVMSPHSLRVPLQAPPPPRRPPAPLHRTRSGGFRTTKGHTAPNDVWVTALPSASGRTTSPGSLRARPALSYLRPKRVPEPSARCQASK